MEKGSEAHPFREHAPRGSPLAAHPQAPRQRSGESTRRQLDARAATERANAPLEEAHSLVLERG